MTHLTRIAAIRIASLLALASVVPAYAVENIEAGAAKAAICGGCHGPNGISVNPLWPNLAGQHAAYISKQLVAFRDGTRVEPTMQPFVAKLTDADIDEIAAFFASRKSCP